MACTKSLDELSADPSKIAGVPLGTRNNLIARLSAQIENLRNLGPEQLNGRPWTGWHPPFDQTPALECRRRSTRLFESSFNQTSRTHADQAARD
jgi:hypothetical protein